LVILLVKLTVGALHHRGHTDFSKAQTATVVGISKRVAEIAGLEACKIKVFPPAFWPIRKEILSDRQDS
jgi:hypothetical protein